MEKQSDLPKLLHLTHERVKRGFLEVVKKVKLLPKGRGRINC